MLTLRAPAKINLFLEVLGKRKDGYHNILTIFLKINLCDRLDFQKIKKGIEITCEHPHVPTDATNLVYKAAASLREIAGISTGVKIKIKKKIPVAAGLGGGSSDAATCLMGLNQLWNLRLEKRILIKLARKLGADVPFFLIPEKAAIGRGRGDKLRPLVLDRKFWIILVNPGVLVSTKEVYNHLELGLTNKKNGVKLLSYALKRQDIEEAGKYLFNRLENVTLKRYKKLEKIKKTMSALGVGAVLMSGSGSTIFGIVENREEAMRIKSKLQANYEAMVVRSL